MRSDQPHGTFHQSFFSAICIVFAFSTILFGCSRESYLEGRVEMRELSIATKYPGRIARLHMEEGQRVKKGQLLAEINDPEADARMVQAEAGVKGASAQESKVDDGARPEEIRAAKANMEATRSQAELAQVTAERMQRLFAQGVIPRQRMDEAVAARDSTASVYRAAQAEYELVHTGARIQDKTTAASVTKAAKGERQLVQAALVESHVIALETGEITSINFREGEIVAPGVPIANLALVDTPWVSFNVREDLLQSLKIGAILPAKVPALAEAGESVELRVYRISVLGDFGTWQSTRALGSYDLRTFEVRARPSKPLPGLRAGMSVLVPANATGKPD